MGNYYKLNRRGCQGRLMNICENAKVKAKNPQTRLQTIQKTCKNCFAAESCPMGHLVRSQTWLR